MSRTRERTLASVCDTFVPGNGELPSASRLGVHRRILSEIEALERPPDLTELNRLLDSLDSPFANLLLNRKRVRFSSLGQEERENYLLGWASSRLALKRRAFQVLKRLTLLYTYGLPGSPYQGHAGFQRSGWSGYEAAGFRDSAEPAPLRIGTAPESGVVEADVCVIGSGAGGSVFAAELAARGKRVVILEQAPLRTERDFKGQELDGFASLFYERGIGSTADRAIAILAGRTVGGGTVVNWNTCLRIPEEVRQEWAAAGIREDLGPHYEAVEARLDVDTEESWRNGPNAILERGLRRLDLKCETIRRNTKGCRDCGPCGFGCPWGAKQSTMRTYLVDACAAGAEIYPGTRAERIVLGRGAVRHVEALHYGKPLKVIAKMVALGAGAIESPALLLRSGIAPERAGHNLFLHPTTAPLGLYEDGQPPWKGVPQSVLGDAFADLGDGYGFRLECPPAAPGLLAASLPWAGSAQHLDDMRDASRVAPFIAITRDRASGRITIDQQGKPIIHYTVDKFSRDLLTRAMVESVRIHRAAGAYRIGTLHTPFVQWREGEDFGAFLQQIRERGVVPNRVGLFSAHQMGTCPIGMDRKRSVADPNGMVWGLQGLYVADASAFPNAPGVNPMMTVMALSRRTAQIAAA